MHVAFFIANFSVWNEEGVAVPAEFKGFSSCRYRFSPAVLAAAISKMNKRLSGAKVRVFQKQVEILQGIAR